MQSNCFFFSVCKIPCAAVYDLGLVLFHVKLIGFSTRACFFFLHSCNENEARLWNPTKRHVYLKLFELFLKLVVYAYAWLCSVLVLHFTTNTQNHCFVAAIEIIKCAQHAFNQLKIQFECLFKALSQKKKKNRSIVK